MFSCTTAQHIYCTNCTICNWTVLRVITQKLLLHVQLHNSTAHLLYIHCTNCTMYNWTVLTVITHKLLLHVQLHNSTAHLLYIYCTNCTMYNWTVLTVITHKLLLHVQLHNNTAHLLYKYCTNSTVCNWTVLTVITHKLLLHVQLHTNTQTPWLMSSAVQCSPLFEIIHVSVSTHSVMSLDQTFQIKATVPKRTVTSSQHYETHPTSPLFIIICVYRQR